MEHADIHQNSAAGIRKDKYFFHKVIGVKPLEDYRIEVTFECGTIKNYNVLPLFTKWDFFCALRDEPGLFGLVGIEPGGYAISWNEELDLSSEELWNNGI